MSAPLLEKAGQALYGPRWQTELARIVGVSDRTMRRWLASPHDIPVGVWRDIDAALLERGMAIERVRNELARAMAG